MSKVDAADLIAWLMIVGMQSKTGNRLSNNSPLSKTVIVRSGEEFLFRMRISQQVGAVSSKLWAEVTTLVPRKPPPVAGQSRVATADHFKLKVRDDGVKRYRRMRKEISISVTSEFFRTKEREDQ